MPRYNAQFRNTVLKKLLPPENRSVLAVAREYNLSVATIYGWKAKMRDGTLQVDDGVPGNRHRQPAGKLSLLLESRSVLYAMPWVSIRVPASAGRIIRPTGAKAVENRTNVRSPMRSANRSLRCAPPIGSVVQLKTWCLRRLERQRRATAQRATTPSRSSRWPNGARSAIPACAPVPPRQSRYVAGRRRSFRRSASRAAIAFPCAPRGPRGSAPRWPT